jgi:uncharacterized protein (DUF169 family)
MSSIARNYSVFDKFNFERKPVGIKYLPLKPDGIKRLDKSITLCEMVKEAQTSDPFYADRENFQCIEPILLGMEDAEPVYVSGLVGERGRVYKEARANRRIYHELPRMQKDSVRYVALSPIDKLSFDPDILTVTADNTRQAQILLRAMSYTSGEVWSSKLTPVAACAWMYIYPVVSGKLNFTATGLSLGMHLLKVFPAGLFLVSIPWDLLPAMIENLESMDWSLSLETDSRDESWQRVLQAHKDLTQEMESDKTKA